MKVADLGGILKEVEGLKAEARRAVERLAAERERAAALERECARLRQVADEAKAELERRGPVNRVVEAWLGRVHAHVRWNRRGPAPAYVLLSVRGRSFRAATLDEAIDKARAGENPLARSKQPPAVEGDDEDEDTGGSARDQA